MKKVELIVKGSFVVTVDRRHNIYKDHAVVVDQGIIVDILPIKDADRIYMATHTVGGDNRLVLPGFINTHTHAAMVGFRGLADDLPLMKWLKKYIWPREAKFVSPEFIRETLPVALAEMIASGITTYADMYFFQDVAAEIVHEVGIRAVLGEGLADFPTPSFKTPKDGLAFTKSFIEAHRDDPLVIPALAPHAPYTCSAELLQKSCEMAREYDVPYLIHVAETKDEVKEVVKKTGLTPIRYLDDIGVLWEKTVAAHMVWLDDGEIDIVKKRRVGVSHNPTSNLKLASGIAPVPQYLKKKIKVGLGTDGAASNNDLDFTDEMHLAALIHKVNRGDPTVVSAEEVVEMATIGGARVLGLSKITGSIEKGKSADLIVINLDKPHLTPIFDPYSHVVYAMKSSDIEATIVRGRILMERGEFRTIDIEKAKAELRELGKRLA